ncbi:MAG: aminoglycoside phosphotransferase family protein [Gammaproteobacteria bacterium]
MNDDRMLALENWSESALGHKPDELTAVAGDASFRRYFRARLGHQSWILMDAPPPREDSGRFVRLAAAFAAIGIHVPLIHTADNEQGFVLLEDLGDELLLGKLTADNVDPLYDAAMHELHIMQSWGGALRDQVPPYDQELLERELGIFREWLLEKRLGLSVDGTALNDLERVFGLLVDNALEQPRVLVHRDFHSRNLLVLPAIRPEGLPEDTELGVIDFQDAVYGPITYDLASLLRDCYVEWPPEQVDAWAQGYYQRLLESELLDEQAISAERFMRWFDLMGMQRHLKAAGIFCRLHLRDGRDAYLADIPRTLGYVVQVAARHDDLAEFGHWIEAEILPSFTPSNTEGTAA